MKLVTNAFIFVIIMTLFVSVAHAIYKNIDDIPGVVHEDINRRYVLVKNARYYIYLDDSEGSYFFYNPHTQTSSWDDPRTDLTVSKGILEPSKMKEVSVFTIAWVTCVPIFLFIGGIFIRVRYLENRFPDLLWPNKVRKQRKQGMKRSKLKARGKLNQDNKGGSSAN